MSSNSNQPKTEAISAKKLNLQRILQLKTAPFLPVLTTPKEKYSMIQKMANTAPFNFFYNVLPAFPQTYNEPNSIKFSDLLCPSLGELKCSLQINNVVDFSWLLEQYEEHNVHDKPLTVLYGHDYPNLNNYLMDIPVTVSTKLISGDKVGVDENLRKTKTSLEHNSKIGIYMYTDGSLRVVVLSGNLRGDDWKSYNQGIWIGPLCKRLPETSPTHKGESPTFFKSNLINYFKCYDLIILDPWISYVERADFSGVKVFLLTSSPNLNFSMSMKEILGKHCKIPNGMCAASLGGKKSWDVNVQVSTIGNLGRDAKKWIPGQFLPNFTAINNRNSKEFDNAKLNIIFPSVENVLKSRLGGGCLIHLSKYWKSCNGLIAEFLHNWSCRESSRNETMPNLATYCRICPCKTKLAWFLFSSRQLSPLSWDKVGFFETDILFIPKFFGKDYFVIKSDKKNDLQFPLMYDPILTKYSKDDSSWTVFDR